MVIGGLTLGHLVFDAHCWGDAAPAAAFASGGAPMSSDDDAATAGGIGAVAGDPPADDGEMESLDPCCA